MRRARASRGAAGARRAAATVAVAVAVSTVPIAAQAHGPSLLLLLAKPKAKNGLSPEQATDRRMPIQDQGRQMIEAGELTAATILFDGAAEVDGDPVLFLDSADVFLQIATEQRDIAAAETAKLRVASAEDVLYFHLDSASDPNIRLVTDGEITGLLARASQTRDKADALIAEIEAEQSNVAVPEAGPTKRPGNGRGLRIAGAGLMGLGVAGLGVGVAGLVIGGINQGKVDDPTVYGNAFDEFDAKGRRGNTIAVVGFVVGGVALAAGTALFIVGRKRGKKAGSAPADSPPAAEDPSVALVPSGRGLALVGRF